MYTEKDAVREFLAGDYGSVSALTLGNDEQARIHEERGEADLAAICRLPIDDAKKLLVYMSGRHPVALQECWAEVLSSELPEA